MYRQALLQEPFQACLCDSWVTTKVEFLHHTPIMAEPLQSRATSTEGEQVACSVGEIGEDVHLKEGLV